jgi:Amt family ammonium transporter
MSAGDTAWVLACSALVLLMTPALAFFYGGMVRAKSVLNMMMMSTITIGIVSTLWILYGFSVAFGTTGNGLLGRIAVGLRGWYGEAHTVLGVDGTTLTVPALALVAFQLMFAIITPALASGAIADRARFGAWAVWVAVWVTVVYFPVAHWVFAFGDAAGRGAGWLARWGVEDFAGGTAVHVNAGAAGLALAVVLGRRVDWSKEGMRPHNVPLVLLGAGLLWFGWFGFNAGSSLAANGVAALALLNTQAAAGTALLGWLVVERIRDGRVTTVGAASGAVAGLVAVTPACAFVTPIGALVLGFMAGAVCAVAVGLKWRLGFDDSLDVVGVHLVGGAFGSVALGFLADPGHQVVGAKGLLYGGDAALLGKQTVAVLVVGSFSFVASYLIARAIQAVIGFRIDHEHEVAGIDLVLHAETAYDLHVAARAPARPACLAEGDEKRLPVALRKPKRPLAGKPTLCRGQRGALRATATLDH